MVDIINPQLTTFFIPIFLGRVAIFLRKRPWHDWHSAPRARRPVLVGHSLLYAAITLVLITGVLMMPASWRFLGFMPSPLSVAEPSTLHFVSRLHHFFTLSLAALALGHLFFVIRHHRKGDPILRRMLPSGRGASHSKGRAYFVTAKESADWRP